MDSGDSLEIVKKVVLVGDSGVGKTAFINWFVLDKFDPHSPPTLNVGFRSRVVTLPEEGVKLKLQIWDTAGQEKYKCLTKNYYHDAQAAIVVYDTTDEDTFEQAKKWISEVEESTESDIVFAIVGNKCDLEDQKVVPTS